MKINIKEYVHKINENVPENSRGIVWSVIILVILIVTNKIIQLIMNL